jgi:ribosomal protein L37AE/L43A
MTEDQRELCRTVQLPHPGYIAPDIEDFVVDHFMTPDNRLLPSPAEPWGLTFNLRRGPGLTCEACGAIPRGRVLVGMRHRRATGELWACRLCSFKLNGAPDEVITAEAAKAEHPETAACRRYVERLRDTSKWSSIGPGIQLIDPDEHTRIGLANTKAGWTWCVRVRYAADDRENIIGNADSVEQAYSDAGWAWMSADRVRLLMEQDRADREHAFSCEAGADLDFHAREVEGPRLLT